MALQLATDVRNARLDATETAIGSSPVLKIRTGSPPSSCADADQGTVLATINLPSDWMNPASNGQKTKSGTWEDTSADDDGVAGHFRIYASDGVTCKVQGTVSRTGQGGDLQVDNTNFAAGQAFSITSFTLIEGNQ